MQPRPYQLITLLLSGLLLASCSSLHRPPQDGPPRYYRDVSEIPNAAPKIEPLSRYGNPDSYMALGKRYHVLKSANDYRQVGYASWYGNKFTGQRTSSGAPYDPYAMTGASKVLPIPTYVKVTNLENGRSVIVKINDRGPFKSNRIIDLSYAAAVKLGYMRKGTALVRVTAINPRTWHHDQQPSSTLFLQVGAFQQYDYALQLKHHLQSFLQEAVHIAATQTRDVTLYRVQIGPIHGYPQAKVIQQALQQHGLPKAIPVTTLLTQRRSPSITS